MEKNPTYQNPKPSLSDNVLSIVVEHVVRNWKLRESLQLRLVNHHFDIDILHQLFGLFQINRQVTSSLDAFNFDETTVRRYWHAFLVNSSPDRSVQEIKYSPDPDLDRYPRHFDKQKRRLRKIHRILREAVDTIKTLPGVVQRVLPEEKGRPSDIVLQRACVATLAAAAVSLLGPGFAWTFIHVQPKPHVAWVMYRSGRDSDAESFCERQLSVKPAHFWVTLAVAYLGDIALVEHQLDHIRHEHRDPSRWLSRLDVSYSDFVTKSSTAERRWLEALSACLTVAISRLDAGLVQFVVHQDAAISQKAFQTMCFNEYSQMELAIRTNSMVMANTLLDQKWLINPSGGVSDLPQYVGAMLATASLPNSLERDEVLDRLFGLSNYWQAMPCLRSLLNIAARKDDERLVKQILSWINDKPDKPANFPTVPQFRRTESQLSPLIVAVTANSLAVARIFLHNDETLGLREMNRSRWNYHEPRIDAMVECLRGRADGQGDQDRLVNSDMVNLLLEHSQEILGKHLLVIIGERDGVNLMTTFFRHIDIQSELSPSPPLSSASTSPPSQTQPTKPTYLLGETALALAAHKDYFDVLKLLLDTHGLTVSHPTGRVVLHPADDKDKANLDLGVYYTWTRRGESRALLTRHRLFYNRASKTLSRVDGPVAS